VVLAAGLLLHGLLVHPSLRGLMRLTLALCGPTLLWLYQEPVKKMELLTEYLWNRIYTKDLLEQLSFPAVSLVLDHALWAAVGLPVLAGYLLAWRRLDPRRPAGVLLILPLTYFLFQVASVAQSPRYLLPGVPAAQLAAAAVAGAWAAASRRRQLIVIALSILLVLPLSVMPQLAHRRFYLGIYERQSVPNQLRSARADLWALRDWVAARFDGEPIVLVGGLREFAPTMGRFEGVRLWAKANRKTWAGAPPMMIAGPRLFRNSRVRLEPLTPRETRRQWQRYLVQQTGSSDGSLPVLVLKLTADSCLRHDEYRRWNSWQETVAEAVESSSPQLLDERYFEQAGIVARLYRMSPAGATDAGKPSGARTEDTP
jgi:hypothetical protein